MTCITAGLALALQLASCERAPQTPQASPPTRTSTAAGPAITDAAPAADVPTADPFALPGGFEPATHLAELQARFGAGNVRLDKVPGAEGESFDGVILFPDDPARRAYLYFQDAQANRGLSMVRVFDAGSRWHFADGIAPGTPLSTLLERNGKPIRFYGLSWDYGGIITDWNGGALAPGPDDPVHRSIRLGIREGASDGYPMGDGEFSSDDPKYPDLGKTLVVGEISVSFPGQDDL